SYRTARPTPGAPAGLDRTRRRRSVCARQQPPADGEYDGRAADRDRSDPTAVESAPQVIRDLLGTMVHPRLDGSLGGQLLNRRLELAAGRLNVLAQLLRNGLAPAHERPSRMLARTVSTSSFVVSIAASGTGGAARARRVFPLNAATPATSRMPPAT